MQQRIRDQDRVNLGGTDKFIRIIADQHDRLAERFNPTIKGWYRPGRAVI